MKILECEQPFVESARKLNNGVCLRVSSATQKIPKVLQDPPRLGIFLYKKFGHIHVEIGIFMTEFRPIWIKAAEMEKFTQSIGLPPGA